MSLKDGARVDLIDTLTRICTDWWGVELVVDKNPTSDPKQEIVSGGQVVAYVVPKNLKAFRALEPSERERCLYLMRLGAEQLGKTWTPVADQGDGVGGRFKEIIGDCVAMEAVFELLEKIVNSESTVLIHGESGTGKELIARAVHYEGPRKRGPFVVQNCSAFNDNLLESALFGHVRGSFTGAVKDKKGLFKVADGGSFFLDEIGDMSPALQVKLLRVIQEGAFKPVGSTKVEHVDVRIIAASHKNLAEMVERGAFREDLYYRINVLKLEMPPLRDRISDLPLLVEHFLRKHCDPNRPVSSLTPDALALMKRYSWPGNIRELENELERMTVLSGGAPELGAVLVSPRIRDAVMSPAIGARKGTLREAIERVESELIADGLARTNGNKSQLAKDLGISRSNLIQKCGYYGLAPKA